MNYDLLIIGAGPAGLGAAIYGMRAGLNLAVIDRSPISGGQVLTTYEVDNYLGLPGVSGGDISERFREHADRLGVSFVTADVAAVELRGDDKIVHTDEGDYTARALILATGATHAMLGAEGEQRLAGMGVSYCATCDGAFFRNRTAAVVGGGDVAVEDAIYLAGICQKVYLIHRRDSLRAADSLCRQLFSLENVEILWNSEVKAIEGEETVEKILVYHNRENITKELPVNGIFIAVGIRPNTELFADIAARDEAGYLIADETCETSAAGVFAAGDVRRKPLRQIITAVADGANAITSVQRFLSAK